MTDDEILQKNASFLLSDLEDVMKAFRGETPELKPCPFCGGKAAFRNMNGDGLLFGVCCVICFGEVSAAFRSREGAAEQWNRRKES